LERGINHFRKWVFIKILLGVSMSEQTTNTEKIKTLVAKIPSLFETWSNTIDDQNDDTISDAWIATVEHFFPDTEDLVPESVLELLKSKKLPCKNLSSWFLIINRGPA
jgi:hypothetical protein